MPKRTKKPKLPNFNKMTLEEIAEFWETHDSADYWDQMEPVKITIKRPTDKIVSVRVADADLQEIKRMARERGLGHTTLIRSWLREKLRELQTVK